MKEGDKVTCLTHFGIWTLVWYRESESTCAIQNETSRFIVKVSSLTVVE